MSKFHGALLFDIADEPIGNWRENLGYRGMMDVWELFPNKEGKDAIETIIIEPVEECESCAAHDKDCECQEIWIHDTYGNNDTLDYADSYDKAIRFAKKVMKKNPHGFFLKSEEMFK